MDSIRTAIAAEEDLETNSSSGHLFRKFLFVLLLLLLPFHILYFHGLIIADLVFAAMVLTETFFAVTTDRRNILDLIRIPLSVFSVYVLLLAVSGLNYPNSNFAFAFFQHTYAASFGLLTVLGARLLFCGRMFEAVSLICFGVLVSVIASGFMLFVLRAYGIDIDWTLNDAKKLSFPLQAPNQLGGFVVTLLPFVLVLLQGSLHYLRACLFCAVLVGALVILGATASRSAFAMGVLQIGILLLFLLNYLRLKRALIFGIMVLAFGMLLATQEGIASLSSSAFERAAQPFLRAERGETPIDPSARTRNFEAALSWYSNAGFFGAGLGRSEAEGENEIHSSYLGLLAELGVPGLAFGILLFGAPVLFVPLLLFALPRLPDTLRLASVAVWLSMVAVALMGLFHYELRQRWVWFSIFLSVEVLRRLGNLYSHRARVVRNSPTTPF